MNGKLTLGENTADNGGLRLAWMALMNDLAGKTLPDARRISTKPSSSSWVSARSGVTNETAEVERLQAQTDPHAIARFRVNGTVSNMPEFQKAFGCKEGMPMVRGGNACRVW